LEHLLLRRGCSIRTGVVVTRERGGRSSRIDVPVRVVVHAASPPRVERDDHADEEDEQDGEEYE
jgi:hypothetical protein